MAIFSKELKKINEELQEIKIPFEGSKGIVGNNCVKSRIAFIGMAPSYYNTGEPFTGKDKDVFNSLLSFLNLSRDKVFITNCVKVIMKSKDIKENFEYLYTVFRKYLVKELEVVQPTTIVLLGSLVGLYFDIPTKAKVFKKMHPAAMHYYEIPLNDYLKQFQDVKDELNNSLRAYI